MAVFSVNFLKNGLTLWKFGNLGKNFENTFVTSTPLVRLSWKWFSISELVPRRIDWYHFAQASWKFLYNKKVKKGGVRITNNFIMHTAGRRKYLVAPLCSAHIWPLSSSRMPARLLVYFRWKPRENRTINKRSRGKRRVRKVTRRVSIKIGP